MNYYNTMKDLLQPLGLYSLSENSIVAAELSAYNAGLSLIEDEINLLKRELFIQTAQDFGLKIWESINGSIMSNLPLEKKRELLIKKLSVTPRDYTLQGIERSLSAMGIHTQLYDIDLGILYVDISGCDIPNLTHNKIVQMCERVVSAHLNVIYSFI